MKLKHSKFKNTGLIFECLVRHITNDVLNDRDSNARKVLQKFFSKKSELKTELAYYRTLLTKPEQKLSESVLVDLINTTVQKRSNLLESKLNKQKYNLIKEIKKYYNIEEFFRTRVDNYKELASIYHLFEYDSKLSPKRGAELKSALVEYHSNDTSLKELQSEFEKQTKEVRLLTFRLLVESFNEKYQGLSKPQRTLLEVYINEQPTSEKLKRIVSSHIRAVNNKINELGVDDDVIKIKLNELNGVYDEIGNSAIIKEDHILATLRYYELLKELRKVK